MNPRRSLTTLPSTAMLCLLALAQTLTLVLVALSPLPAAGQTGATPAAPETDARAKLPSFTPTQATPANYEIILIHGLGGAAGEWDQVEPYLKGTFKVATFELSGHGRTQPVMDPTVETESKRLEAFIRTSGMTLPTLVGHGLGGMIALQYALDHPGAVHRLILMDAAPRQLAGQEQKVQIGQALIDDYDRFVAERYALMSPDEAVTKHIVDMALRTHAASFVSMLMSSFDYDMTDRLRTLTAPLLVIGSEMMFPDPDETQPMLEQFGYAQARSLSFKRFGKTGHYIMLEQPVLLASVLMAFGVTAGHEFKP